MGLKIIPANPDPRVRLRQLVLKLSFWCVAPPTFCPEPVPVPLSSALRPGLEPRAVYGSVLASAFRTLVAISDTDLPTFQDASALLPFIPAYEAQRVLNELPSYLIHYNYAAISNSSIPVIGQHYFANTGPAPVNGTPTFDLGHLGYLTGKKVGAIKAPKDVGVDWLYLTAKEPSTGLSAVYRVNTVKGQAPKSCAGQPKDIVVQYAALYWFYE